MNKKGLLFVVALIPFLTNCKSGTKQYNIKWVNYDDSILYENKVKENDTPTYTKSTPKKPMDEKYTYKFNGWDPEPYPATKDQIYKATFREVENYVVTWHIEGKEKTETVDIESIKEGKLSYKGVVPSKSNSGETYYYFDGWNAAIDDSKKTVDCFPKFNECSKDDDQDNDGLVDYLDPQPKNNKFNSTGHYKFGSDEVTLNNQEFILDYQNMFLSKNADNYTYNQEIAKLAAAISMDKFNSGDYGTLTINEDLKPAATYEKILERFGCDEIDEIILNAEDYTMDTNDLTSYIRAKKTIKDKESNVDRDFVFLLFKQHNPDVFLWHSNFDVGYDGKEYYDLEGNDHEQYWKDSPENHKGFYIASYRAYNNEINGLKQYLKSLNNPVVFLSGYSRGGAIANIVSDFINNDDGLKDLKLFSYTFASPRVYFGDKTKDSDKNKNIFNILNKDDIVQAVPFTFWTDNGNPPIRHGVDIEFKMSDNTKKYNERTGTSYEYVSDFEEIIEPKMTMERYQLYTFIDSGMKKEFSSLELLNQQVEKYKLIFKTAGLSDADIGKYFQFSYEEGKGCYYLNFKFTMCGIMKVLECLLLKQGKLTDYLDVLDMFECYVSVIEKLVLNGLSSVSAVALPHFISTYSILVSQNV